MDTEHQQTTAHKSQSSSKHNENPTKQTTKPIKIPPNTTCNKREKPQNLQHTEIDQNSSSKPHSTTPINQTAQPQMGKIHKEVTNHA